MCAISELSHLPEHLHQVFRQIACIGLSRAVVARAGISWRVTNRRLARPQGSSIGIPRIRMVLAGLPRISTTPTVVLCIGRSLDGTHWRSAYQHLACRRVGYPCRVPTYCVSIRSRIGGRCTAKRHVPHQRARNTHQGVMACHVSTPRMPPDRVPTGGAFCHLMPRIEKSCEPHAAY